MDTTELYDIIIVGAGPAGLFSAFYAGMRKAKTKIIDSLPQLGGQLATLYPEKKIYDIAGFPEVKAIDLVENLTQQVSRFNHSIHLNEKVIALEHLDNQLLQVVTNKGVYHSKTVILAVGNGSFLPRKLTIPEASLCEGKTLHYHIASPHIFKNKHVTICGGGDSAIDWALMLEPLAKSVTLIHRRNEFRAHEHSIDLLKESSVCVKTPYVIKNLIHTNGHIQSLSIYNPQEEITEALATEELIVNYGFTSSLGEIKEWGLTFQRNTILVNSDMSTNIPGVFAVGDVCTYDGKIKLIATGFGEAPTAVNNALHYINPNNRSQPTHSTSLFS